MAFLFSLILATATPTPPWWPTWTAEMTAYWRNLAGTATASAPGAADTAEAHAWASQAAHARGTPWGWPSVTATPTTEPTPTLAPTATATPKPAPTGPTETREPLPTATAFTAPGRTHAPPWTRTATATASATATGTETPKTGAGRVQRRVYLPLLIAPYRTGTRTLAYGAGR